MIIAAVPLEFDGFGDKVPANLVVYVCLVGLAELVASSHIVHLAVFDETGARLMEAERDIFGDTLLAEGQDPVIVARTRIDAGLTAHRDFFYRFIQICG